MNYLLLPVVLDGWRSREESSPLLNLFPEPLNFGSAFFVGDPSLAELSELSLGLGLRDPGIEPICSGVRIPIIFLLDWSAPTTQLPLRVLDSIPL